MRTELGKGSEIITSGTQGTYPGSESSLSETAGTTLSGGNSAGLTAVRPLWITSITYLGDRTTPVVRHTLAQTIAQATEQTDDCVEKTETPGFFPSCSDFVERSH